MLHAILKLTLTVWAALSAALCFATEYTTTDDLGRTISLKSPAKRIVSLAPHNTEVVFKIGAGDRIVGTVHYSDYPEAALKIPRIGGYDKINLEKVITLQPDLILAWQTGNDARTNKRLEEMGFPVYYSEPKSLTDIANNMARLGILVGLKKEAEEQKNIFLNRYKKLKEDNDEKSTLRIYYEVWKSPRYTLGGTHFSQEIFSICSGRNIFDDVSENAPIVSLEAIITRNPQIILTGDRHGKQSLKEMRNEWLQWPQIDAVKNGHIYYVDADIFTRSTPRALDGAEHLCKLLDSIRQNDKK